MTPRNRSNNDVHALYFNLQLFAEEKTEEPTPKRKEEARRKGQIPRTAELGTAFVILAGLPALTAFIHYMIHNVSQFMTQIYTEVMQHNVFTTTFVHNLMMDMTTLGVRLVLPIAGVALIIGFSSQLMQVGFIVTGEAMQPKLERLNPLNGLKRMLSKRAVIEFLKALLKTALIGTLCFFIVRSNTELFPTLALLEPTQSIAAIGDIVSRIGLLIGSVMLVLAVGDYAFQRYEWKQSIKMSKQEVKEEMRQSEGDPQLRSRLRQRQREIAMNRMMQDVPKADVIVTNPTHIAVALQYDADTMDVPIVLAKGVGKVAEKIRDIGREHDVAVVENVWLARSLFDTVSIGDEIPAHLYQAVAELLAFVYRLRARRA